MIAFLILVAVTVAAVKADDLRIVVYNRSNVQRELLEGASYELRRVLRQAGINPVISAGDPCSPEGFRVVYSDLVDPARLTEAACRARRDIALAMLLSPPGVATRQLGMALPLAPNGLNVLVYTDHVALAALAEGRAYATVLGHVMAHEIGHVLLKTLPHVPNGLMADAWADTEYVLMEYKGLLFTREQSRRMRATLKAYGCTDAAERPSSVQASLSRR